MNDVVNSHTSATAISVHRLVQVNATFVVCQAQNDDAQAPSVKDDLKAAFAAAKKTASAKGVRIPRRA